MTVEALHGKHLIAAELAHRDMVIDTLSQKVAELTDQLNEQAVCDKFFEATTAEFAKTVRENARLCADNVRIVNTLYELVCLMQGVIDGDYEPDSLTLQPAREVLENFICEHTANRGTR